MPTKYGYSNARIKRKFFSVNSRPGLAYPFEERSNRGLRQHSGVSTRFRHGSVSGRPARIKNRSEIGPGFVLAGQNHLDLSGRPLRSSAQARNNDRVFLVALRLPEDFPVFLLSLSPLSFLSKTEKSMIWARR